ncbi:MAG: M23 family metallopeptidase [Candidatus Ancaeobacter aquaticus]|nr:M23 family metallopeptidase [Candidatus Ancaeobacter aquaticus]
MRHHPVLKRRIKHTGIDIRARDGTKVYATAPGRVIFAGWNGGYGNMVKIDHGDTLLTYYAHLSKIVVRKGDHVMKGSYIGLSGHSGRVTGPHLHYELRYKGKSVNPKWGLP